MLLLLTIREPKESSLPNPLDMWLLLSLLPGAVISRDKGRLQTWNTLQTQLVPDHRGQEGGSTFTGAHLSTSILTEQEQQPASPWSCRPAHWGSVCWWNVHITPSLTQVNAHVCRSPASAPSIEVFEAFWSDPKPFIQLLGHFLSLPTFWIPTCWLVQLEFYQ